MVILLVWFTIPAAYLVLCIYFLFIKKEVFSKKSVIGSLIGFSLGITFGAWQIFSSRSSTASIGMLFLPLYSIFPAILAGLAIHFKNFYVRLTLTICLILIFSYVVHSTLEMKKNYKLKDDAYQIERVKIIENESWIKKIENTQPKEANKILTIKLNDNINDRTWLIPLAQSQFLNQDQLHELSLNKDMSVVLSISKNPKTSPQTITNIYTNHSYPDYFFMALAENESTPKEILLSLFEEISTNSGIEKGLARNKKLPLELANTLVNSDDSLTLGELARNPNTPCSIVTQVLDKIDKLPSNTVYIDTAKGWAKEGAERCLADKEF